MAVDHHETDHVSDDEALPLAHLMQWAGALISLLLILGLTIWGYKLLVRDVSGVPVVRALEGPMRVAPEDPGGEQADYQGLSVTQVAVEGAEEQPTDRVVLAPPPVDLEEEDQPVAALIPDTPSVEPEEAEPADAIELALAEALGETLELTGGLEPEEEVTLFASGSTVTDQARVRVIPASIAGVAASPRPPARPASFELIASVRAQPAVQRSGPAGEVSVDDIAPGTRLVQLGAFPTEEEARAAWDQLQGPFGDYFAGKRRVLQEASAGGKSFYRLRAVGFEDLSDARRFCTVLVTGDAACIPVIRR